MSLSEPPEKKPPGGSKDPWRGKSSQVGHRPGKPEVNPNTELRREQIQAKEERKARMSATPDPSNVNEENDDSTNVPGGNRSTPGSVAGSNTNSRSRSKSHERSRSKSKEPEKRDRSGSKTPSKETKSGSKSGSKSRPSSETRDKPHSRTSSKTETERRSRSVTPSGKHKRSESKEKMKERHRSESRDRLKHGSSAGNDSRFGREGTPKGERAGSEGRQPPNTGSGDRSTGGQGDRSRSRQGRDKSKDPPATDDRHRSRSRHRRERSAQRSATEEERRERSRNDRSRTRRERSTIGEVAHPRGRSGRDRGFGEQSAAEEGPLSLSHSSEKKVSRARSETPTGKRSRSRSAKRSKKDRSAGNDTSSQSPDLLTPVEERLEDEE